MSLITILFGKEKNYLTTMFFLSYNIMKTSLFYKWDECLIRLKLNVYMLLARWWQTNI
jgi:hypothetical protein